MKIPVWLATLLVSALLASQAWLINAVIDLKVDMGSVKSTLSSQHETFNHQP